MPSGDFYYFYLGEHKMPEQGRLFQEENIHVNDEEIKKKIADMEQKIEALESESLAFNDYQDMAWDTAIYPNRGKNIYYPTLGLCGETGEVAEKVKKVMRDYDGILTMGHRDELMKEISDVLWYLAALCTEIGVKMEDVAKLNIKKLQSRKERGKLKGDGDNR